MWQSQYVFIVCVGVLLTGFTPPGSVVCFFPGIVVNFSVVCFVCFISGATPALLHLSILLCVFVLACVPTSPGSVPIASHLICNGSPGHRLGEESEINLCVHRELTLDMCFSFSVYNVAK